MDGLQVLSLMGAVVLGVLIALFFLALTITSQLAEIIRHLQAQGPVLMKQARWLQISTAHAWMQRSYLQRLCVRAGLLELMEEENNGDEAEAGCSDTGADVGADPEERHSSDQQPDPIMVGTREGNTTRIVGYRR